MTKKIEELRKIITEQETALLIKEQQRLLLNTMERNALEKLKEKLADEDGIDEIPSVDILQQLYKKPEKSFAFQGDNDWTKTKIFENFSKEFGKENIQDNCLYFPDNETADTFFRNQAQNGHAFLFQQKNCDNYTFSDGKNHYKMGSKAEIISYCKQNSLTSPFREKTVSEEQTPTTTPRP